MKENLLFVIFILSAAAIDSDNSIIPGIICLCAVILLFVESRNYLKRKNLRQQVQSVKQNIYFVFIITRGKENAMVVCKKCGGNCDNGELIGGVCPECLEEERQIQIRSDSVIKMMHSQSYQMKLRLEEMRNG